MNEPEGVGMNGYALPLERVAKLSEKCYDALERKRLREASAYFCQIVTCIAALGKVLARMVRESAGAPR